MWGSVLLSQMVCLSECEHDFVCVCSPAHIVNPAATCVHVCLPNLRWSWLLFLSRVHVFVSGWKMCVCGSFWTAVEMFVWVGLCEWVKQPVLSLGLEVDLRGPKCVWAWVHNVSKRTSWRCWCVHICFRKATWCNCACVSTFVCLMRQSKCYAGQIAFILACRVSFVSGHWCGPLCMTDLVFRCRPLTGPPAERLSTLAHYFRDLLLTDSLVPVWAPEKLHGWLDRHRLYFEQMPFTA